MPDGNLGSPNAMDPAELPKKLYWYAARLQPTTRYPTGVVDGDSMHITQDMGDYIYRQKEMRVANVNAPEISTPSGRAAKQWAVEWFISNAPTGFYIHTHLDATEKYGRILAMIYAPSGACFNDDIVNAGMAVPYQVESYD